MKIKPIFFLLACFVFHTNLFAQSDSKRWVYVGTTNDGDKYYLDSNVKRQTSGFIRGWVKIVRNDRTFSLYLEETDCKEQRTRLLGFSKYSVSGELLETDSSTRTPTWSYVIPETIGEDILQMVCGVKTVNPTPKITPPVLEDGYAKLVPKYQSEKNDIGVDIVVLIVSRGNLRESPDKSSTVIREVGKNNMLVLLDRNPVGAWYKVIDVDSGKEGWINGNNIEIQYTRKSKKNLSLEEYKTNNNAPPYVIVSNDSYKTLTLTVGDQKLVIPPNNKRTLYLSAGSYSFYATAPGVIPAFGERYFSTGSYYEWSFYIVTK